MDKGKFPLFGLKLFGKFGIFFLFFDRPRIFEPLLFTDERACDRSIDRPTDQDFSKRATNVFYGNRKGRKENKGRRRGEEKRAYCKINKLCQFRESDRICSLIPDYIVTRIVTNFTNYSNCSKKLLI